MGEVFAGASTGAHGFSKPVAIKRLLPELTHDHVFVERLVSEAKLLVNIQHGNIVSVLDLVRDGDDVFLVMEFVDGPSLQQLLKSHRKLPLGVSTYIIQSAAAGLEYAHARPNGAVIHADISPSNILLTTAGEVRVADFGIARRDGVSYSPGIIEGKWAYMAPEQAAGEVLTPRSDVFALGVVLYQLITGKHPFQGGIDAGPNAPGVYVVPPNMNDPSIPAGLAHVCMRALAPEPRDRFRSMHELIDALVDQRFANGWREGANDLARLISEVVPNALPTETQLTKKPLTIMSHSLISASARKRASASELAQAQAAVEPSGATTVFVQPIADPPPLTPSIPSIPVAARASMSSFYGGELVDAATQHPRTNRRSVWIVGSAAMLGVIAALVISRRGEHGTAAASAKTERVTMQTQAPNVDPQRVEPVPAPEPPPPAAAAQPPVVDTAPAQAKGAVEPAPTPAAPVAEPVEQPHAEATIEKPDRRPAHKAPAKPKRKAVATRTIEHATPKADEAPEPKAEPKADVAKDAVLKIQTIPEVTAKITIDNRDTTIHGQVPGAKFTLTPGRYHVMLSNPKIGVWIDCGKQSVEAGTTTVLVADVKAASCRIDR